jgi:hypothetical protein
MHYETEAVRAQSFFNRATAQKERHTSGPDILETDAD